MTNDAPFPQAGCRGLLCPCPCTRGKVRMGVWTPRQQNNAPPVPQAGCRGAAPAGGTACPPVPKNIGGWAGGTTAHAKPIPPLKDGASHNKTIRPAGASCPSPRTRRMARKRRLPRSPSRVQGAQPPPGVQGESPCFQKRWRVGRWDNSARQANPPAEGRRKPKRNPPSPRTPRKVTNGAPSVPHKQGAGNPWFPPGGAGGVPLYPKTLEGGPVGQQRRPSQSPC